MASIAVRYGAGAVVLVALAVLTRLRRFPGLAKAAAQGSDLAAVSAWTLVAAALVALSGAVSVVQRAYAGEPNVYTCLRAVVAVAMLATMVRILRLFR